MSKLFECAAVATWSVIMGAMMIYVTLYALNIIYTPAKSIDPMPVSRFAEAYHENAI